LEGYFGQSSIVFDPGKNNPVEQELPWTQMHPLFMIIRPEWQSTAGIEYTMLSCEL
jgi:hypothetical protein